MTDSPTSPHVNLGTPAPDLDSIALASGGFAMVAMDQRESLRAMFDLAGAGRPADPVLVEFKRAVARALAPRSSGFLIDRHYGFEEIRRDGTVPETSGLILAADALTQQDGGPVEETDLDETVLDGGVSLAGVSALKLLIIWRRDAKRGQRVALAHRFVAESRRLGLLSVLEPVVRATAEELDSGTWDADEAIREAARELSVVGQDLYKVQVPLAGLGDAGEQRAASEALAADIRGPWVVLSQGVERDRFTDAVRAACRAGASGFLSGRALWSDIVGSPDTPRLLTDRALPRLEALREIVETDARPWRQA
ncbi:hypothetical protein [Planctomonas psychrotolerans]|uniref:hypothetical protein n=1 Tax=Planctomonas psychrotolerans TaxID=2528712 RepID=UPI00123A7C8B|nr:hypothetical protein [Planctomonas psychrotolerans]